MRNIAVFISCGRRISLVSFCLEVVMQKSVLLLPWFHGGLGSRYGLIAEVIVSDRLELFVEFVNEWDPGWYIELRYLLLRYFVKVLYERPEAVAVSRC